ncbi:imidazolonepropionase [Bacillus sp. 1P06AnD]|uniref:imidazolonepropionase n=1 Tax=Bacillus sp. 1P06AnD TaxID=3132208 RepID=UPI0039A1E01E
MANTKTKVKVDLLIQNANEIITCKGTGLRDIGVLHHSAIAIHNDVIVGVGKEEKLSEFCDFSDAKTIDATGKVIAPGFIDSHTHLVFYGTRVEEYAAKLTGESPEKLKELGITTGPSRTVELTRHTPSEDLYQQSRKRVLAMLDCGITTIESKSGYGLTTESEIKILEIGRQLDQETPLDIFNTFLGAHGFPENTSKEEYMKILLDHMIPEIGKRKLAEFCDVWCDEGYFTADESETILQAGLKYGMQPKIHADAYSYIGGTDLAAKMNMVSADHLNYTPDEVLKKLKEAKVTGVLMPALDFAVRHKKPFNARKMLDMGMSIALATDLCPACYTTSMQFVIVLACRLYQFSVEEAILAATYGGAQALGLSDRGRIEKGQLADLQIWDVPGYKHIAYELGTNIVETVIKRGKVVVQH